MPTFNKKTGKFEKSKKDFLPQAGKDGLDGEKGDPGKDGKSVKGDKGDKGCSIKGDKGDSIKGDKGEDGQSIIGPRGLKGKDGREVELRRNQTHIQWRYVGEKTWIDLIVIPKNVRSVGGGVHDFTDLGEIDFSTAQDGYVLSYDEATDTYVWVGQSGGGGASAHTDLTDMPSSTNADHDGRYVRNSDASVTDNTIARYDATTGRLIQGSGITVDDSGNLATSGSGDFGNIEIAGADDNTITVTDTNGNLLLSPNGTGNVDVFAPPASEAGGININGTTYTNAFRINDIGGNSPAEFIIHKHSTGLEPVLLGARTNSNTDAHIAVTNGQGLIRFVGAGYSGTHYDVGAQIVFKVADTGTISTTSLPGEIEFYTTPDGSNISLRAGTIDSEQNTTFTGTLAASNLSGTNTGDITVTDSSEIDFTLTGQDITASIIAGSIDETKLDASTNTSLNLADSALQSGDNISELTNDAGYVDTGGTALTKTGTTLNLDDTTVTTGVYGGSGQTLEVTVDQQGRITSASESPINHPVPSWTSVLGTGRVSGGTNPQLTTTDRQEFRDANKYIHSPSATEVGIVSDGDVTFAIGTNNRFEVDTDVFVIDNTNARGGMNLGDGVNPSQLFHAKNTAVDSRAVFRFEGRSTGNFAIIQCMNSNGNAMGWAVGTAFSEDFLMLRDLSGIMSRWTRASGWLNVGGSQSPARSLDAQAGISNRGAYETRGITSVNNANYVVVDGDYIISMENLTTGRNVSFPASGSFPDGYRLQVMDTGYNSATNNITLVRNGSDRINNVAGNFTINTNGKAIEFMLKGNNWHIMSQS